MTGIRKTAVGLTLLALMGFALPNGVQAGFEEGVTAYEAKDYKKALDEWLPLAKANDPAAMRNVGHLYRRGLGTQQDFKKALTWYKRAATMGFDRAQANVAGMYLNGEGVEQDFLQAASWFAKAAEQGHVLARYNLGLMFETGLGVSQNLDKARALFELAAGDGHPQAKERLALLKAREDKEEDPDKEIVVAIERPPKAPEPPAPANPPAAAVANSTEAAKPAEIAPTAERTNAPPADNPVEEKASDVTAKAAPKSPGSVQKKGFYDALKSLKAEKPAPTPSAPVTAAAATAPAKTAATSESAPKQSEVPAVPVKAPEVVKAEKIITPAPVKAEPERPVVVASAPPPPPPAPKSAPVAPTVANGLTLEEKLEMADLAFALQEYQQSLSIWAILAQEGHAEAQYKLGNMFHNGLAVPVDRVRAYIWWEKAKKNGYADAAPALAGLEKTLTHMEKRQIQRTN